MKVSELRKALEGVQDELEVVASGSGRFFDKVLDADRAFAHDEREGFRKPVGCIVQMGVLLLDNDFFGGPDWRALVATMRDGGFRVCFSQGINARLLGDEEAEALGSLDFYDDAFKARRIYTAWDNAKDDSSREAASSPGNSGDVAEGETP